MVAVEGAVVADGSEVAAAEEIDEDDDDDHDAAAPTESVSKEKDFEIRQRQQAASFGENYNKIELIIVNPTHIADDVREAEIARQHNHEVMLCFMVAGRR